MRDLESETDDDAGTDDEGGQDRRIRSPHPGVVVLARMTGTPRRKTWRARYVDPDTRKTVYESLTKHGLTSKEARRTWAIRKSKLLASRRTAIELGARRLTKTPLGDAVAAYLRRCEREHRKATVDGYRISLDLLTEWTAREKFVHVEEIDDAALVRLRDRIVEQRRPDGKPLAASSVNHHLRQIGTAFHAFRRRGLTPLLRRDEIADSLRGVAQPRPEPSPLSPKECADLLRACLRHDVATFKLTRREHAQHPSADVVNGTRRYDPIGPLVLFYLLTGARSNEALALPWSAVDLDARDAFGNAGGVVRLSPLITKTKIGRDIDLSVCPAVRSLLAAMRLRSGGAGYVFGGRKPLNKARSRADIRRLVRAFGAPAFSPQTLRQTAAAFYVNAPGVFGGASLYRSCAQLGHAPDVATRFYLDVVRGVSPAAKTIEQAMGVEALAAGIVSLVRGATAEDVAELAQERQAG